MTDSHKSLSIDVLIVGPFEVNCFFLFKNPSHVLVIDPGEDAALIIAHLAEKNRHVAAYLLTHGHTDHACAIAEVCQTHPAPVLIPAKENDWMFSDSNQLPPFYPAPKRPEGPLQLLTDGDTFTYGDLRAQVIATPGHSPGGVCYYFPEEGVLIAGDTLFKGSVGRTDLPGGDAKVLAESLKKLKELPPETIVYPGHGPSTTIGIEKRTNTFMK